MKATTYCLLVVGAIVMTESAENETSCTNTYGEVYPSGVIVPKAQDVCNTCLCKDGKFTACTRVFCQEKKPCTNTGQVYPSGEMVPKAVNSCNSCFCENGEFTICTEVGCID